MGLLRLYQANAFNGLVSAVIAYPGEVFTVMFPRQSGKNEVLATIAASLLLGRAETGGAIVVCAPTRTPQANISFERVLTNLREHLPPGSVRPRALNDHTIGVGRARVTFLSASPAAHVAGHTASIALMADEAQDIDAEWFDRQFRPMAASTGAPTLMFGTAWDGHSLLERSAARNRQLDRHSPMKRHFDVSWEEVGESNRSYLSYVLGERARLGPRHPLFLTQYELVAARGAGRLLSEANLQNLHGSHPRRHGPAPGDRYVGGLDIGGEGAAADASVAVIARLAPSGVTEVVDIRVWASARFASLRSELVDLARAWRLERLVVDATGLGGPIASDLEMALGDRVEALKVTSEVKSELGYNLIAAANTGALTIFADDASAECATLWDELRICRASHHARGRLSWGNATGHDDHAFALALVLRAASTAPLPRVATGRPRAR